MPGNFKKEDLRVFKTNEALMNAMTKLLILRNFSHITVNELCEEAQISRPTFYSHFIDKYDLLERWLKNFTLTITNKKELNKKDNYVHLEKTVNHFVTNNSKIIKHLIEDANNETFELLCNHILSILNMIIINADSTQIDSKQIVFFNFCSGGIMNYLSWQVKNKFPNDLQTLNLYIYDLIINLQKWYAK